MTYFTFLAWFIGIPLLLLVVLTWWDQRQGRHLPVTLQSWPIVYVILAHVVVAVLYTTPWDNYLVATRVWWYDPALVTGVVLGWVPIEEYTFFVAQTLLSSLWLLLLARRFHRQDEVSFLQRVATGKQADAKRLRWGAMLTGSVLWLAAGMVLLSRWSPGTYLALELVWALPPIIFQLWFGADILWHYRRIVGWGIAIPTIYLAATDTIAIGAGTWTIDPAQSTGLFLGTLPVEEFIFFLVTNVLVVFGTILVLAQASQYRVPTALQRRLAQLVRHPVNGPHPTANTLPQSPISTGDIGR
ncbi:MAG: lycopene cyclase domain-containing protein [Caldilineaceae bacterium]